MENQFDKEGFLKTPTEQLQEAMDTYGTYENVPQEIKNSLEEQFGSKELVRIEVETIEEKLEAA